VREVRDRLPNNPSVRIAFMNFSGVMPCRPARSSDKILWHIEGDGTACERRRVEPKFGNVLYKRLEFKTVVNLDVIDDCCGPLSFAPAAHDAP
jgi:hypothetical protein